MPLEFTTALNNHPDGPHGGRGVPVQPRRRPEDDPVRRQDAAAERGLLEGGRRGGDGAVPAVDGRRDGSGARFTKANIFVLKKWFQLWLDVFP